MWSHLSEDGEHLGNAAVTDPVLYTPNIWSLQESTVKPVKYDHAWVVVLHTFDNDAMMNWE